MLSFIDFNCHQCFLRLGERLATLISELGLRRNRANLISSLISTKIVLSLYYLAVRRLIIRKHASPPLVSRIVVPGKEI